MFLKGKNIPSLTVYGGLQFLHPACILQLRGPSANPWKADFEPPTNLPRFYGFTVVVPSDHEISTTGNGIQRNTVRPPADNQRKQQGENRESSSEEELSGSSSANIIGQRSYVSEGNTHQVAPTHRRSRYLKPSN
ncbi:hypothetical protein JYU34_010261 [Plutella xylostella]|uniref:Uncharacterized protein n=2 Tax=Plutella xylostella TaxID=51655 RepID=A0ABQ7QI51_PLUXY|nr:hypothetical protein JYU34_010261 [Plutella xylostella]